MTLAFIVAFSITIFDQIIKKWTTNSLHLHASKAGIEGVFDFYYIRNKGAGWGILQGQMWFFYIITLIIIVYFVFLIYKHRQSNVFLKLTYGLLLGGAVGNFIDRVVHGYVIDMFRLSFINFPIFNIADVALSLGILFLIIQVLFAQDTEGVL